MAKKHNGLILLGAAMIGAAAGAYLYFKKTDADRFDEDDFDFDDFDEHDEDENTKDSAKRSYVPLNLDNAKPEDAQAEEPEDKKEPFDEESETIEEFFDEEDPQEDD